MAGGITTGRLQAAWLRLPDNARGALWVVMGTVFLAFTDSFAKLVGATIHPIEMAMFRYAFGFILLTPAFLRMGAVGLRTERLKLHLLRALIAGTGQAMVFYAVIHLMLADATAIGFSRPLFVTLLAAWLLGEAVGWRRAGATAVGFVGVLIMVRPGQAGFDPASLVAITSAVLFSFALIIIRRLASTEPPMRILFYYHVFGFVMFSIPTIWMWRAPNAHELLLLGLLSVTTTAGMVMFVRGFSVGEASIVGPMEYTRLVYAALLGYFIFFEVPDLWTVAGAAIIVASTYYVARYEAMAARRRRAAARPP